MPTRCHPSVIGPATRTSRPAGPRLALTSVGPAETSKRPSGPDWLYTRPAAEPGSTRIQALIVVPFAMSKSNAGVGGRLTDDCASNPSARSMTPGTPTCAVDEVALLA